jgi:hypothetical protein
MKVMYADAEYCFGKPKVYLTPIETARLVIVRSRLGDTCAERAAEKLATVGTPDQSIENEVML